MAHRFRCVGRRSRAVFIVSLPPLIEVGFNISAMVPRPSTEDAAGQSTRAANSCCRRVSTCCSVRTPDEISVDDVARSAGISRGLLYHYFEDRDAFVVAVLERASAQLRRACAAIASSSRREQVEAAIEAFIGFAEAHAAGFRALLTGRRRQPQGRRTDRTDARTRPRRLHRRRRRDSRPRAARRSTVLRAALHAHMHFMEGAVVRWLARREITRAQLRELILRALDATLAAAQSTEAQESNSAPDDSQR